MKNPKVTIILATYNRAHLIMETLASIKGQSYTNFECLIIDDGGTDNTLEVIGLFLNDKRFSFYTRPENHTKGLPGCRNYGLEKAQGDYIIFFDDDDIVHPKNLEITVKILLGNKDAYFCHYQKKPFSGNFDSREIKVITKFRQFPTDENISEKMLKYEVPISSCNVLWKKECFNANSFNETLQYAEEWECYQRILSKYWKGIILDCVLYFNRKHPNSNTGEFWSNNILRKESKKKAIILIVEYRKDNDILTHSLLKHLAGLSISYSDKLLLNQILTIAKISLFERAFYNFKFVFFPIYRKFIWIKKIIKIE